MRSNIVDPKRGVRLTTRLFRPFGSVIISVEAVVASTNLIFAAR
jgi:hypothetical protein